MEPIPARERGGVGLIVILVALVIGALLAMQALRQYGLAPRAAASKAPGPGEPPARAAAVVEAPEVGSAPPTAGGALERARGVEETLKRQADERAARMDGVK
jgi:hypothetical protein